jgi:Flp pilus assembly pilin Flp
MRRGVRAAKHHTDSALEYALILAVIGLAIIVTFLGIGGKLPSALTEFGAMAGWSR